MSSESDMLIALQWITDTLNQMEVPFQIVGGLAAKCYGSTRPLHDIDIYVPGNEISRVENELREYIEFGPSPYRDENWDLIFMKLNYKGQQIEIGDADHTRYYDSESGKWTKEEINFSESNILSFKGIQIPVMPKKSLITYKERLNREVDQIDIREMQNHN